MKKITSFLALIGCLFVSGCMLPQIDQQDIADFTNAVQQVQQIYEQIQPAIEQLKPIVEDLKPLAEQYLKGEAVGSDDGARGDRSSKWQTVRDRYAREHPLCVFCGRADIDVHHIHPVHLFPLRELDPDNLVSLCRVHHFIYGHGGDWKGYNPDVLVDKEMWKAVRATTGGTAP